MLGWHAAKNWRQDAVDEKKLAKFERQEVPWARSIDEWQEKNTGKNIGEW
jgi:hypothetical protein